MDLAIPPDDNSHQAFSRSLENGDEANNFVEGKNMKSIFHTCIGIHELFSLEMWRATTTELVSTSCLLFTLTTSIISCLDSKTSDPKLLIPFTVFIIAFFFLVTTIPLSGGHMNPIFTFIATFKGLVTPTRALCYIIAQCLGSVAAYMVTKAVMDHTTVEKYSLGGCIIDANGEGTTTATALMLEFCCTFVVLYVGVTVGFDKRRFNELGIVMVCAILAGSMGLAVFVSITVTGKVGYGGVGLNPARCLGSALVHGGPLWHGHWVFWLGPFLACVVYYAFTLTLPKENMLG